MINLRKIVRRDERPHKNPTEFISIIPLTRSQMDIYGDVQKCDYEDSTDEEWYDERETV